MTKKSNLQQTFSHELRLVQLFRVTPHSLPTEHFLTEVSTATSSRILSGTTKGNVNGWQLGLQGFRNLNASVFRGNSLTLGCSPEKNLKTKSRHIPKGHQRESKERLSLGIWKKTRSLPRHFASWHGRSQTVTTCGKREFISLAMRKPIRLIWNHRKMPPKKPAKILRCWPAMQKIGMFFKIERCEMLRTPAAVWPAMRALAMPNR